MFKAYVSKRVKRLARKILIEDLVVECGNESSTLVAEGRVVQFKHYQPVEVGDYVVYLNDNDVYHMPAEAFEEQNEEN